MEAVKFERGARVSVPSGILLTREAEAIRAETHAKGGDAIIDSPWVRGTVLHYSEPSGLLALALDDGRVVDADAFHCVEEGWAKGLGWLGRWLWG